MENESERDDTTAATSATTTMATTKIGGGGGVVGVEDVVVSSKKRKRMEDEEDDGNDRKLTPSEIFETTLKKRRTVCVQQLPKIMRKKKFKRLLSRYGINPISLKKLPGNSIGFVVFESEKEMNENIEKIEAIQIPTKRKGDLIHLKASEAVRKKKVHLKRATPGTKEALKTSAKEVVTPLWDKPYEMQLEMKQKESVHTMVRIARKLRKKFLQRLRAINTRKESEKVRKEKMEDEKSTKTTEKETSDASAKETTSDDITPAVTVSPKDTTFDSKGRPCRPVRFDLGWLKNAANSFDGKVCPLDKILASPLVEGYRNKCTFTIGKGRDGKTCTGFRLGSFHDSILLDAPTDCPNIAPVSKLAAAKMTEFLDTKASLPIYNTDERTGFWRSLLVRHSTKTKQVMLMAVVNSQDFEPTKVHKELEEMKRWFLECPETKQLRDCNSAEPSLRSLYVCRYGGRSHPSPGDSTQELLWGSSDIEDVLLGVRFKISPLAFFQVNSAGAEVLYKTVRDFALDGRDEEAKKRIIVLDVCCGTGAIGLCVARSVRGVVGVECCAPAIENAKENAALNKITNVYFRCAMAEKVTKKLLTDSGRRFILRSLHIDVPDAADGGDKDVAKAETSEGDEKKIDSGREMCSSCADDYEIVAIVDPPRAGLHMKVIRAIRKCSAIRRLVYVSCNPSGSFIDDATNFCKLEDPKQGRDYVIGEPFKMVKATPVDMFPHTDHCEMVATFERAGDGLPEFAVEGTEGTRRNATEDKSSE
eukprot:g1285.t1